MTYSRIFHLNEYFFSAHLVETNGCQLEGRLWLSHDESLGFNIFEGHFDTLVFFSWCFFAFQLDGEVKLKQEAQKCF